MCSYARVKAVVKIFLSASKYVSKQQKNADVNKFLFEKTELINIHEGMSLMKIKNLKCLCVHLVSFHLGQYKFTMLFVMNDFKIIIKKHPDS